MVVTQKYFFFCFVRVSGAMLFFRRKSKSPLTLIQKLQHRMSIASLGPIGVLPKEIIMDIMLRTSGNYGSLMQLICSI